MPPFSCPHCSKQFEIEEKFTKHKKKCNASEKGKEESNSNTIDNPYDLLGIGKNSTQEEIKKAYHHRIRLFHPDKAKKKGAEELAKKLIKAYQQLKDKESREKLDSTNMTAGGGPTLATCIMDKSVSENFRRIFQAHLDVAEKTKFANNFGSFYTSILSEVETPVRLEEVRYQCQTCDRGFAQFNSKEEHLEDVCRAYFEWLGDSDKNLFSYLEELLGKEEMEGGQLLTFVTEGWGDEKIWGEFEEICGKLEILRKGRDLNPNDFGDDQWVILTQLMRIKDLSIDLLLEGKETTAHVTNIDLILPAFLVVFKEFNDWNGTAKGLMASPHLGRKYVGMVFAKIGARLGFEDCWPDMGLMALEQGDVTLAHLCFVLGSCDLRELGRKLATMKNNTPSVDELAAQYFVKSGDFASLLEFGKLKKSSDSNRSAALKYFIPAFLFALRDEDVPTVITILKEMLPEKKFWKCIKALMIDVPDLLFASDVLANMVFDKMVDDWNRYLVLLVIKEMADSTGDDMGAELEASLRTKDFDLQTFISVIPGVLHILGENVPLEEMEVEFVPKMKIWWEGIVPQLIEVMVNKLKDDMRFLVQLVSQPKSVGGLRKLLTRQRLLGPNEINVMTGSTHYAKMLVLRGILNYHEGSIHRMTCDFEQAILTVPGNTEVANAISFFLASDPIIPERILALTYSQFESLRDRVDQKIEFHENSWNSFSRVFANMEPKDPLSLTNVFSIRTPAGDILQFEKELWKSVKSNISEEDTDDDDEEVIIARKIAGKVETEEHKEETIHAGRGYSYLDISLLAVEQKSFVGCYLMAMSSFYKAMISSDNIPTKFAYRGIIFAAMEKIRGYNLHTTSPNLALYVLKSIVSFGFKTDYHFGKIVEDQPKTFMETIGISDGDPPVNFIDEDTDKVTNLVNDFQLLLNLQLICPLGGCQIFTAFESLLVHHGYNQFTSSYILQRVESQLFSVNCPGYLYHHFLLMEVWDGRIDAEEMSALLGEEEEEELLQQKNADDDVIGGKGEKEEQGNVTTIKPIPETLEFSHTRAADMIRIAERKNYRLEDVERMMNWTPIRRTASGFMDTEDHSLNFEGEQTYNTFITMTIEQHSGQFYFDLEPAQENGGYFTPSDISEIMTNEITDAVLSFDPFPGDWQVAPTEQLPFPSNPFFHVRFSPKNICGTNFLMTLYHLDLLAKILTTGQEVSSRFPFEFKDTREGLIKMLPTHLQRMLRAIGPRKKVRNLRVLERIHRFWFQLEEVEEHFYQDPTFPGRATFRYGNVTIALRTQPMLRDPTTGVLEDADEEGDDEEMSPEKEFVRDFNKYMGELEEYFPIIRRAKELAKICAACNRIYSNKEILCKAEKGEQFKQFFNHKLTGPRPYSNCEGGGGSDIECGKKCCNWVPAVYHEMKVTDEQKLEHLLSTRGFGAGKAALLGKSGLEQLEFQPGSTSGDDATKENVNSEKEGEPVDNGEKGAKQPEQDVPKWEFLEQYRVYGGVLFMGNIKSVPSVRGCNGVRSGWSTVMSTTKNPPPPPPPPPKPDPPRSSGRGGGGGSGGGGSSGGGSSGGGNGGSSGGKGPHGNDLKSKKPQWGYTMKPSGGDLLGGKIGISGTPPTKTTGKLPRVTRQINQHGRSGNNVDAGPKLREFPDRQSAVEWEKKVTEMVRKRYGPDALKMDKTRYGKPPTK